MLTHSNMYSHDNYRHMIRKLLQRMRPIAAILASILVVACASDEKANSNADVHVDRAQTYQGQYQYRAADIEWRNAIKKSEDKSPYILLYAQMLTDQGNYASAIDLLSQWQDEETDEYRLILANAYIEIGKSRSALVLLDSMDDQTLEGYALQRARALISRDRPVEAKQLIERYLKTDPNSLKILGIYARLAFLEGNVALSEELIARMQEIAPDNIEAKLLRAGIFVSQDKLEDAETLLSAALAQQPTADIMLPERADILERLSYVLTRLGRVNEAYAYNKLLSEAYPGAQEANDRYGQAMDLFRTGDLEGALQEVNGIIESFPGYRKAIQLAGVIEFSMGNVDRASEILAGNVDPEIASPLTTHVYAATTMQLENPTKVVELLEPEIGDIELIETLVLYSIAASSIGKFEAAETTLKRAIALDEASVRPKLVLASIYANPPYSDEARAFEQIKTAYQVAPQNRDVLTAYLSYIQRTKGIASAKAFLKNALSKSPRSHAVNLVAGYFEVSQQSYSQAKPLFETAVKRAQGPEENYLAYTALGGVLLALDELSAAEDAFSNAVVADPSKRPAYEGLFRVMTAEADGKPDVESLYELGKVHQTVAPYAVVARYMAATGSLEDANQAVERARAAVPEESDAIDSLAERVRYAEALAALRSGDNDLARERIAPLAASYPDNIRIQGVLLEIEIAVGNEQQAAALIEKLERTRPDHLGLALAKGDLALRSNSPGDAAIQYERIWAASPSPLVADKLINAYFRSGQNEKRDQILAAWRTQFPDDPQGLLMQTLRYQERGLVDEASEGYRAILEIAPDQVAALNNLGWIYYEKNDFKQALPLLERAIDLAPESAPVLDSYGWVLVESGEVAKGIPYLEKASQLAPEAGDIQAHLLEAKSRLKP